MNESIANYRQSALVRLNASEEELRKGLETHRRCLACDGFGFLPSTWSFKACETLKRMIERGASYEELALEKGVLTKLSHMYDETCRAAFIEAIRATGLDCVVLTVGSEMDLRHSLHRISWYAHMFDMMGDALVKATRPRDVESARESGKLAVICSANAAPANGGLESGPEAIHWLDILYRFGVRVAHLTYNRRNWIGDGCMEPANAGLSLHGKDVVRHMNDIGMMIDTAHSGQRTTLEAAGLSSAPIVATHTSCQKVYDHPRGKSDEELRIIAEKGGFVGICVVPEFLGESGDINALLDHVEHAVDVAGVDHVAIGTDRAWSMPRTDVVPDDYFPPSPKCPENSTFAWTGAWNKERHLQYDETLPAEYRDSLQWTNWPYFTVGLLKRGFSEGEIEKIVGMNVLRTFATVQAMAEPLA